MHTPTGFDAESSARWLIDELAKEAALQDSPLGDWDLKVLSSAIVDFQDNQRHLVEATHNLAVNLARSAIERAKELGVETVEVREGLILPQIWEDHYETVYASELPWMVSLVMQNAFLGNPFIDEPGPWNSPDAGTARTSPSALEAGKVPEVRRDDLKVNEQASLSPSDVSEQKNKAAIYALVLGIASVFLFGTLIIPIASMVIGGIALGRAAELKTEGVEDRGFGFSLTGLILGIVYTLVALIMATGLV